MQNLIYIVNCTNSELNVIYSTSLIMNIFSNLLFEDENKRNWVTTFKNFGNKIKKRNWVLKEG